MAELEVGKINRTNNLDTLLRYEKRGTYLVSIVTPGQDYQVGKVSDISLLENELQARSANQAS